jgi:hypothetical protein
MAEMDFIEDCVDLLKKKLFNQGLVKAKSSIESFSYYLSISDECGNEDFLYHLKYFLDNSYNMMNNIEGLGYLLNNQHKEKRLILLKTYINQIISQLSYLQSEKTIINEVDDKVKFLSVEPVLFYVLKTILRNCILNCKNYSLPLTISTISGYKFLKIIIKNAFLFDKSQSINMVPNDYQICELCLLSINGKLSILSGSTDDIEIKLACC